MSYADRERSTDAGQPLELYEFAAGTRYWRYTAAAEPQTHQGQKYRPVTIERSKIQVTDEINKSNIELTVARDNAVAAQYVAGAPDARHSLTVFRRHAGDGDTITFWKGRVVSVIHGRANATIKAEPLTTALARQGLRPRYQAQCRHALYDAGCRVNPQNYRVDAALIAIDGPTIDGAAWADKPDGWFTGGLVLAAGARRLIEAHAGTALTLSQALPGAAVGDTVTAFAGCDHALATCRDKFDNLANNGAFPYVPDRNPFSSAGA